MPFEITTASMTAQELQAEDALYNRKIDILYKYIEQEEEVREHIAGVIRNENGDGRAVFGAEGVKIEIIQGNHNGEPCAYITGKLGIMKSHPIRFAEDQSAEADSVTYVDA